MLRRKNKPQSDPERRARRVSPPSQPTNPAFSYYTSRVPDATARRMEQQRTEQVAATKDGRQRRHLASQLPMWLLAAVVIVCVVKLLFLGTDPKVVILGKSQISETYLQPGTVYETVAQKLLASSITNRTKLTANLDGTAAALQQQFPELSAVSLTLPLIGNRPIVYAVLAQPSAIVQTLRGNYALNASGLVLAKVTTLPAGVPLVVDQSSDTPHPGHQYLPGSTVSFIRTMSYQLTAAKMPVTTFVLPLGAPYELDVRLEGKSFVIRCSLVSDALTQSGAAIATLQQLGTQTPANYLDVRVPGRVYYK